MAVDKNNIWHGTVREALQEMLIKHSDCMCSKAKELIKAMLEAKEVDDGN